MSKKGQEKGKKDVEQKLPPEVSSTIPAELSSSIEAMKETSQKEDDLIKKQWEEKKNSMEKKKKTSYRDFSQKIAKGEGTNPILKKNKNIGGVRGKFHPSKKGKH